MSINLVSGLPNIVGYQIRAVAGEGSEAAVYVGHGAGVEASESSAGRGPALAFKFIDGDSVRAVATSMVLLRGIASEHIAMPRALARDDHGGWWMVSDYVQGAPLRPGPVDPRCACEEALGVACALAKIHACGTHHGDVSAANVVGTSGGGVRLIDFGCLGQRGTGTPGFLAPEVLAGSGGAAADWFGLGALLSLRLTGEVPWRRPGQVAGCSVHDARARVEEMERGALASWPKGVAALLADLLDPRPEVRDAVGLKVCARLERILAGDSKAPTEASRWSMPTHIPWLGASLEVPLHALGGAAPGRIIVISGPDGSGRGRAARELALQHEGRTMAQVRWLDAHQRPSSQALTSRMQRARRAWLAA